MFRKINESITFTTLFLNLKYLESSALKYKKKLSCQKQINRQKSNINASLIKRRCG